MRKGCAVLAIMVLSVCVWADTFKKHTRRFPVGPNPGAIVAPDLNGDGWPEIVTADVGRMSDVVRDERPANDQLSLLVSQGKLTYVAQPQLQTGFAPYCVVAANMDATKALDLVVGNFVAVLHRNTSISLFRNIGNRDNGEILWVPLHFTVPQEGLSYTKMLDSDDKPIFTKPGVTSLAVADFNRDGYRDVVATGWSSDVLIFMPGTADTYLGEPRLTEAAGGPRDVKGADFDRDGNLDLVVTLYGSQEVGFWRGDGTGTFEPVTRFPARGHLPHKVQVGDVNGDGVPDVIVSHCYEDDSLVIFFGDGGFQFSVSQEILLGTNREVLEHEIRDFLVADLDGDGKLDIAAACYASSQVIVLLNKSQSHVLPQVFSAERYSYDEGRPRALCTADFDGNNRQDIGVALWETNQVGLLLQKGDAE